jgi:hypothetical protein
MEEGGFQTKYVFSDVIINAIIGDFESFFCFLHKKTGISFRNVNGISHNRFNRRFISKLLQFFSNCNLLDEINHRVKGKTFKNFKLRFPSPLILINLVFFSEMFSKHVYNGKTVLCNEHYSTSYFYLRENNSSGAIFCDGEDTIDSLLRIKVKINKGRLQ